MEVALSEKFRYTDDKYARKSMKMEETHMSQEQKIQVVHAAYSSGACDVTVFHFLVRIEQYGRKAMEKAEKEAQKSNK
jgi:hypothetical protein